MTPHQLESRTLQIIERVLGNQPVEDALVELKSEWPKNPYEAARQLAGHANAARGEPIIWIIGIHDKSRTVTGADALEMSQWYAQMKSHHDAGMAPAMITDRTVAYDGKTLVSMVFDTQGAPYLVKNPEFGKKGILISLEMPWRQGTAVRSASKEDILRLVEPLELVPECEVRDLVVGQGSEGGKPTIGLNMTVYVHPRTEKRMVIPVHRCTATLRFPESGREMSLSVQRLQRPLDVNVFTVVDPHATVVEDRNQVIITGPGEVHLNAGGSGIVEEDRIEVVVTMLPSRATTPIIINEVVTRRMLKPGKVAWKREGHP